MTEIPELLWLVVRLDIHGNWYIVGMEGGAYGWNLSEREADSIIEDIEKNHQKPHGQSYWKYSYRKGTLQQFLVENKIKV